MASGAGKRFDGGSGGIQIAGGEAPGIRGGQGNAVDVCYGGVDGRRIECVGRQGSIWREGGCACDIVIADGTSGPGDCEVARKAARSHGFVESYTDWPVRADSGRGIRSGSVPVTVGGRRSMMSNLVAGLNLRIASI